MLMLVTEPQNGEADNACKLVYSAEPEMPSYFRNVILTSDVLLHLRVNQQEATM
jgi:hypothetical protein